LALGNEQTNCRGGTLSPLAVEITTSQVIAWKAMGGH
jgi:hypothetical protein